jgi:signal transduction histidine kinase
VYKRPHFTEYIMARLVTLSVATSLFFSLILLVFVSNGTVALEIIAFLIIGFSVFIYAIYRGAVRMQKELVVINKYLENLDKVEKFDDEIELFTQEFEDINQNLIKVIKSARKRDQIKQRYNAKLKLKNKQRGDMISAIAHEFRNPIASIMGYSQTLEEDKEIPSQLRDKFLGKIYNNSIKIEALLSRLVLWNKFESGEATLHKSIFDMFVLAQEVKLVLEEQYKNRVIHIEGDSLKVEADRTLMEIVLKNLIENALKYSKDEVILRIAGRSVSVIDKGVGINSYDVEKVTKKFYRSGTHNWDNSMGLGLSIIKTILSMHHSKLQIDSEEGKGSVFSFIIEE